MPSTPFSEWKITSRPAGTWSATMVGMPMPRLTYQPSGMSRASRWAIWPRLSGVIVATVSVMPALLKAGRITVGHVQNPVHEDAGRHNLLRVERAELDQMLGLYHGGLGGHRHHGIEVATALPEREVAPAVGLPRLHQRDVAGQRAL